MTTEALVLRAPRSELVLSLSELCAATGLSERQTTRLLRLGIIESNAPGSAQFTAATAYRLKRMGRLQKELGVGSVGASIILRLLERLADLEGRLARSI
jgi:hypothetical protein